MSTKCTVCKEYAVQEEDGQEVCSSCGAVALDSSYTTSSQEYTVSVHENGSGQLFSSGGLPYQFLSRNMNAVPVSHKVGKRIIDTLCSNMSLGKVINDCAFNFYTRLCSLPKPVKHMGFEKKSIFCCACIYIACREYDLPVTISYIASAHGQHSDVYLSAAHQIEKLLGIQIKLMSVGELVEAVVTHELQPGIVVKNDVKVLTQNILELLADLFLTQGRKPTALVAAVLFLAYKNEDFLSRRKLKPSKVIKKKLALTITQRLNLIRPSLIELLKGIPWVSERDHRNEMIPYYLKDIVNYKKTLMKEALRRTSIPDEGDDIPDSDEDGTKLNEINIDDNFENESGTRSIVDSNDDGIERKSAADSDIKTPRIGCSGTKSGGQPFGVVSGAVKRELDTVNTLFFPPAYKKARRRSSDQEEIQKFIEEGRAHFEQFRRAMASEQC